MNQFARALILLTFSSLLTFAAVAQVGQAATGSYPLGTFDSKGFDTINVGNLNVNFSIPVLNKAGRGIPLNVNLVYDSSFWSPSPVNGVMTWIPALHMGWTGIPYSGYPTDGYLSMTKTIWSMVIGYPPHQYTCTYYQYTNWIYHDKGGTQHPFSGTTTRVMGAGCTGSISSLSALSTDGSGYSVSVTNYTTGVVTLPSGKQITPPSDTGTTTLSQDASGNYTTIDAYGDITDTTGNQAITIGGGPAPADVTMSYKDTNGASQAVTISFTSKTLKTAFNCGSTVADYTGTTSSYLVSKIAYPDGSFYSFTYEPTTVGASTTTGRIATVQLPQGGIITYTYGATECADGSTAGLTRKMSADSGSDASTWTYVRTSPNGGNTSHTEVVDGLNNYLEYDFIEAANQTSYPSAVYYETARNIYNGPKTGTAVISRQSCYNGATRPCTTSSFNMPISEIAMYETLDGKQTHGSTIFFNAYGKPTESDTYDFNTSGSWGSKLEKETWSYNTNFPGLPMEDDVYDGSTNQAAKTVYGYDAGTPRTSSGVPNHNAPTCPCGNLTSTTQYASSSLSYTSNTSYEDTGSILTSSSPFRGTTTMGYDPSFVYKTSVQLPTPSSGVSQILSSQFDTANSGMPLNTTDQNLQQAIIKSYDSMLRPTEIDYPDGGKTTYSYTPTEMSTIPYQNSATSSETDVQFDAYGRRSRVEVKEDQSGDWYQKDTCYDANGNVKIASYSYQGTGFSEAKKCSASSGDSYSGYDVLGRVGTITRGNGEISTVTYLGHSTKMVDENGVGRIATQDGLGRLTEVCEISSNGAMPGPSGSPASCNADITGTGFITSYAYDLANHKTTVTQGSQTRVFQNDWLGRPILVQEPESGQTTYGYTSNSTGLVVTRTRPPDNQNASNTVTTTQYDVLSRVLTVSYTDGTPTKTFAYDTSAGWSDLSQQYLNGHISSATAGNAASVFSYDKMGRIAYLDECLPSACSSTHKLQHYTYDWSGNLLTSTDGNAITSTYSYSISNETLSLTSSKSAPPKFPAGILSNVQYGSYGPVSFGLGNGLSGFYSYDGLGRVSGESICQGNPCGTEQYGFTSSWRGGRLTNSTDTVENGNAATTYGYDEFNRLVSVSSSAGNMTETYDRWGNRWQQTGGGSQPNLTFDIVTNRLMQGTCNPPSASQYCYDAAGEMTADGVHTYTYDAEGNVTAVDGGQTAQYTYNALNQRVRTVVGSTARDFLFNVAGQRVTVWDGTTHALVEGQYYWGGKPLAYYDGTQVHFQHQDWLGTERMRTSYSGSPEDSYTSLPYGDLQATGPDTDPYHFANLDYDSETATDHAQHRQYSTYQARWLSPDPYAGSYNTSNPQTLNRYTYAINRPGVAADPSGFVTPETGPWIPQPYDYISAASLWDCSMDGQDMPCDMVYGFMAAGAAVQCPDNECLRVGAKGLQFFLATTNGAGAYYNYSGPGSLFYSVISAGVAAVEYSNPMAQAQKIEYSGYLYSDPNGLYSYTAPSPGYSGQSAPFVVPDFPDGYQYAGFYHDHAGSEVAPTDETFSFPGLGCGDSSGLCDIGIAKDPVNQGMPWFLGTPDGRVEMYDPQQSNIVYTAGCVLIGTPVSWSGTGNYVRQVPLCP